MGPGGIGTTRGLPTARPQQPVRLLRRRRAQPRQANSSSGPPWCTTAPGADDLIDVRYQASIDPDVVANPPLRRPSGPLALHPLADGLTWDPRLKALPNPTLVLWGPG